jgi:hypothetical protein
MHRPHGGLGNWIEVTGVFSGLMIRRQVTQSPNRQSAANDLKPFGCRGILDLNIEGPDVVGDENMIDTKQGAFGMKGWSGIRRARVLDIFLNIG